MWVRTRRKTPGLRPGCGKDRERPSRFSIQQLVCNNEGFSPGLSLRALSGLRHSPPADKGPDIIARIIIG